MTSIENGSWTFIVIWQILKIEMAKHLLLLLFLFLLLLYYY